MANVRGNILEDLSLGVGKHELIPGRSGLDSLREILQSWTRVVAARIPQGASQIL